MTPDRLTGPIPKELLNSYGLYAHEVDATAELATMSGLSLQHVNAILENPENVAELEANRTAMQKQGKLLPGRVRKCLEQAIDVIEKQLKDGCDIDAALECIKPLIRLTEVFERTRLAEREVSDTHKLAVIHITIGRGPVDVVRTQADVIDVQAVQISADARGAL